MNHILLQHASNGFIKSRHRVYPGLDYTGPWLLLWRLLPYRNKVRVDNLLDTFTKATDGLKEHNRALIWWSIAQMVVVTLYFLQETGLGHGLGLLASYLCAWAAAGHAADICVYQRDKYVVASIAYLIKEGLEMDPSDYFTLGIARVDPQRAT